MFEKKPDEAAVDQTGSIGALAVAETARAEALPEDDMAYARVAALEVLSRGGKGSSQPWENPQTGARGTVTPIASARTEAGVTCQDFLASYLREGSAESWLQGEGCRAQKGKWEVRSLKPWKTS